MKKLFLVLVVALTTLVQSCGPKDADIKTAVSKALAGSPALAGLVADVKDGVATISGEVDSDAAKAEIESLVKAVKGVKSVVNNASVKLPPPPPAPVVDPAVEALSKAVTDAIKDFPGVAATVKDGIVTLTGEIPKAQLQKLMIGLNALKSVGLKSIESKELVKK